MSFRAPCGAWLVLTVLVTGLAACRQETQPEKPQTRVVSETVELSNVAPTVSLTGEIRAEFESELSFRVSGRIIERNVDVGQHVTADQVLAKIDPQEQKSNVMAAEAGVRAAEAQLKQASSTFSRQKELLGRGFTTRRDYDTAEEALRKAEGSLAGAKAQLATAQDQLAQTVLRAGVAGVITARNAEAGQVVQAAQPVFSIAHDGPRDAVFYVHESLFDQQQGSPTIEIRLVSNPTVKTTGKVREVAPTVDPLTGTIRVKVGLSKLPAAMTLGAAVIGSGQFKPRELITVPASALTSQDGRPSVWVLESETGTVSLRPIIVDRYETSKIIVREGLKPGDVVVTAGGQFLRQGQTVALAKGEAP